MKRPAPNKFGRAGLANHAKRAVDAVKSRAAPLLSSVPNPLDHLGPHIAPIGSESKPTPCGLTIRYMDGGYLYDEVADWWREVCSTLPCFARIKWPGYDTRVIPQTLERLGAIELLRAGVSADGGALPEPPSPSRPQSASIHQRICGEDVVIQLWKGLCPHIWQNFPGGLGAEVGVYRQQRGRISAGGRLRGGLAPSRTDLLWWPIKDRQFEIKFELFRGGTNDVIFRAKPKRTWWRTKWMDPKSYERYREQHGGPTKIDFASGYKLRFWINGRLYPVW